MDIGAYQRKRYGAQPCWELVVDVLANETGLTVPVEYSVINRTLRQMADAFRFAIHKAAHGFAPVAEPADFCIVLMGRTAALGVHHCGIWYQGKVLHAQPDLTLYEPLESVRTRYKHIEFWSRANAD